MKLRTLAVPAVIALSGAFLAACGDTNDDLSPAPGTTEDVGIVDPTTAPDVEPTDIEPTFDDDSMDDDATEAPEADA